MADSRNPHTYRRPQQDSPTHHQPRSSADMYGNSSGSNMGGAPHYDYHDNTSARDSSEYVPVLAAAPGPRSSSIVQQQYPPPSPTLHGDNHLNDSTAFLNKPGSQYSTEKFIGSDGPPAHMLNNRSYPSAAGPLLNGKRGGAKRASTFTTHRKWWLIGGGIALVVIVAAAVGGGIAASKKSSTSSSKNGGIVANDAGQGSGSNSVAAIQNSALRGGNGTVITMANGTQFTYTNNFGGYWVSTPFDDSARPNSWTKPLNQSWDYTNDKSVHIPLFAAICWLTLVYRLLQNLGCKHWRMASH